MCLEHSLESDIVETEQERKTGTWPGVSDSVGLGRREKCESAWVRRRCYCCCHRTNDHALKISDELTPQGLLKGLLCARLLSSAGRRSCHQVARPLVEATEVKRKHDNAMHYHGVLMEGGRAFDGCRGEEWPPESGEGENGLASASSREQSRCKTKGKEPRVQGSGRSTGNGPVAVPASPSQGCQNGAADEQPQQWKCILS